MTAQSGGKAVKNKEFVGDQWFSRGILEYMTGMPLDSWPVPARRRLRYETGRQLAAYAKGLGRPVPIKLAARVELLSEAIKTGAILR